MELWEAAVILGAGKSDATQSRRSRNAEYARERMRKAGLLDEVG